jgi:hypothetical protein
MTTRRQTLHRPIGRGFLALESRASTATDFD